MFRNRYRLDHNGAECKVIDLNNIYVFLESLADDLEDKKLSDKQVDDKKSKNYQLNFATVGSKSDQHVTFAQTQNSFGYAKNRDDYMYEIKDKNDSALVSVVHLLVITRFNVSSLRI